MNLPKGTGNSGIEKEAMIFSRPNKVLSFYSNFMLHDS